MALQTQSTDPRDAKASSLTDATAPNAALNSGEGGTASSGAALRDRTRSAGRRGNALWVDILLLVLVIGILIGGWFGYRALRDDYAPDWEERDILILVEITGADTAVFPAPEYLKGTSVYVSDRIGAPAIGIVESATLSEVQPVTDATSTSSATIPVLTLHITTTARYREGQGYVAGDTPVLAGMSMTFRTGGSTPVDGTLTAAAAEGTIIAIYETAEPDTAADS